jgi:RimJ/RimL family protein N-acetyltransferase
MKIKRYENQNLEDVLSIVEECGDSLFTNMAFITRENVIDALLRTERGYSVLFCVHDVGIKGFVTINNIDSTRNSAYIGNIAVKKESAQLLGLEASKWIIDYCFNVLNLNRVYGHTWSDNPKMDAFYKRLGAIHEGTEREHTWKHGQYVDLKIWGILRKEWYGRNS